MANWSNPTLTSLYTDFLSELKARDTDLALQFDGTTSSNLSTGTIRWNSSVNRWQKWNGTSWGELTSTYALTGLSTTGNASIGGTLAVTGATTLAAATATTPATADNSTAVATTAYVRAQAYAPLASPTLTGTPAAPTAAANTNTTQLATTAFVIGQGATATPLVDGTAAVGTSLLYARQDHVHPTDTSRAPLASPSLTGTIGLAGASVKDWSASNTDIDGLIGGSTFGSLFEAFTGGHFTVGLRSNDIGDGFQVISKQAGNATYTLKCFEVLADGNASIPGTFTATTFSGGLTGNATTATTLQTARTINGVSFNGSANITVTASTTQALTAGSFITSTGTFDGSTARTFAVDATSANTASKVVARDASGNFSAGTITAALTGTASGNLALAGGTLTGALIGAAGTVSAPGVAVGEAGTGLFRPATGVLAFSSAGSEVLRITASDGLALGSTLTNANVGFRHSKSITGSATSYAQYIDGTVQADVTGSAVGIGTSLSTVGSQSISSLVHYQATTGALGASTTLLNQIGFSASSTLDGATNDFGFYGNIASGTGNWNCYMVGTAANYFAGQVQLGSGSTSVPALSFASDTNTGLMWDTADQITVVAGGAKAVYFNASNQFNYGNIYITTTDDAAATSGTTLLSSAVFYLRGKYWNGTASTNLEWSLQSTPTSVTPNSTLGFRLNGSLKASLTDAGLFTVPKVAAVAGSSTAPSYTSSTYNDAGIYFPAAATLAVTNGTAEVARFTSDSYLRMAASAGGVQFNGDTAAVNALDDYEEGTFTPTVVGTPTAGTGTYSVQVGRYTKIGQRVYFQLNMTWTAHTGTTNMIVGALPFTSVNVVNASSAVSIRHSGIGSPASTVVQGFVSANGTTITLESVAVAGGSATALALDTGGTLVISGHYEAA